MTTVVNDFTSILGSITDPIGQASAHRAVSMILTYSFPTVASAAIAAQFGAAAAASFSPLSDAEMQIARAAFAEWGANSGLQFVEVQGTTSDIRLQALNTNLIPDPSLHAWALGYSIQTPFFEASGGIWPQAQDYWVAQGETSYEIGGNVFFDRGNAPVELYSYVMLHEIGHTLRFKHSFEPISSNDRVLTEDSDSSNTTIMTHTTVGQANHLAPFDIQAAQFVYGPPSADGDQLSSWHYDASTHTMYETGRPQADLIRGTGSDDVIDGQGGQDVIYAAEGNDLVLASPNLHASGGFGLDTLSFKSTASAAGLELQENLSWGWIHMTAGDVYEIDFERIRFADKIIALDVSGNAGQAYRMYQAAFARTPDNDGVSFWVSQVDKGLSLHDLAFSFIKSAEFQTIYGASPSFDKLVTGFYTNVLGRAPDSSGLGFWVAQVQNGLSAADLLVSFSESAENKAHVAPAIQNGIELSLSYFA